MKKSEQISTDEIVQLTQLLDQESQKLLLSEGCSSETAGLLKDIRYKHEKEIRSIIRLTRRDHRTEEECKKHPLAGLDMPVSAPTKDQCPQNIFVPFGANFIESLQMDGRLPDWRRKAIETLFNKFGLEIATNTAFISTPEQEEWHRRMSEIFN